MTVWRHTTHPQPALTHTSLSSHTHHQPQQQRTKNMWRTSLSHLDVLKKKNLLLRTFFFTKNYQEVRRRFCRRWGTIQTIGQHTHQRRRRPSRWITFVSKRTWRHAHASDTTTEPVLGMRALSEETEPQSGQSCGSTRRPGGPRISTPS